MKKILIGIVIAAVVVGAVLLAGPGLVGNGAERALKASLNLMSQPGVYRVELTDYQRGWFSSTATSRFVLEGDLAQTYQNALAEEGLAPDSNTVTLQHKLSHGPLLMTADGPKVALAYAETDLQPPPSIADLLEPYLDGKPLFDFQTTFSFNGASSTEIHNPPYSGTTPTGMTIRWDGIAGTLVVEEHAAQYGLRAPKFRGEGTAGTIHIDDVLVEGDLAKFLENLWTGDLLFSFPKITVRTGEQDIAIDDLTFSIQATSTGGDRTGAQLELRVAEVRAPGTQIGETSFSVALENLDAIAADAIAGRLEQFSKALRDGADARSEIDALMNVDLASVFTGASEMTVAFLGDIDTPEIRLKGDWSVAATGENNRITALLRQNVKDYEADDLILTDSMSQLTLNGLNGTALADMYRDLIAISMQSLPADEQQQQLMGIYARHLPNMVDQKTKLSLDALTLNVPAGSLRATASLAIEGDEPLNLMMPVTLFPRLDGMLSAQASEDAMLWLLSRQTVGVIRQSLEASGRSVTQQDVEQLALTVARDRLNGLLAEALLRRERENIVVDATIRQGALILNGVPRPDLFGGGR
ncbi:MAG: DUF945 family protein [Alphaproteobacteria bacterium]